MAKILISSIGIGQKQENGNYAYRPAKYFLASEAKSQTIETPVIISALKEFYGIEKLILLGTSGSDWASFYEYIFGKENKNIPHCSKFDFDYYAELSCIFDASRTGSVILPVVEMMGKLERLKDTMGDFCDSIHVLDYGTNHEEISNNFFLMRQVADRLKDGDELFFDISHAFRSLPFYELLAVNLARQTMGKKIDIVSVSYGMLEAKGLFGGCAPIVNLSRFTDMMEWMKASEEYGRFGTAYLLAELFESGKLGFLIDGNAKKALRRLGDTVTGIEWDEFINLVKNCVKITNDMPRMGESQFIIGHIFEDIVKNFGDKLNDRTLLFAEMAKRHYRYRRYIPCSITLVECLLDFCASLTGSNRRDKDWGWKRDEIPFREKISNAKSSDATVNSFLTDFRRINHIRNHLAHGGSLNYSVGELGWFNIADTGRKVSEQLEYYTEHVCAVIKNLKENRKSLEELKKAIQ